MDNYDYFLGCLSAKQIIIVNSPFSTLNLKDGKLECKRPSFTFQKATFCRPKDGLLQRIGFQMITRPVRNRCADGLTRCVEGAPVARRPGACGNSEHIGISFKKRRELIFS